MIPRWKIKRELQRIQQRFGEIPHRIFGPARTRRYDANRKDAIRITVGGSLLGAKVAVYLLWQPGELLESTIALCKQLAIRGYSTLIVSNAPISEKDKARLVPLVWHILERPNVGYDFGGYRDGILFLWEKNVRLERLLLFNDSVWFVPTPMGEALDIFESSEDEVFGTVVRRKKEKNWIESYFFSFSKAVFESRAFSGFWRNYILSDNKYIVIRKGERDFGVALEAGGIKLRGLLSEELFMAKLKLRDAPFVLKTLKYANAAPNKRLADERSDLVKIFEESDKWVQSALRHIEGVLRVSMVHSQFGVTCMELFGFPFIKKSNDPQNIGARSQYLRAVSENELPRPKTDVLGEIEARQKAPARKNPAWMNA